MREPQRNSVCLLCCLLLALAPSYVAAQPLSAPALAHIPVSVSQGPLAPPLSKDHGPGVDRASILESFGRMPLYFVENQGQLDPKVAYYLQGSDKTIYFTPDGVTFALTTPAPGPTEDAALPQRRIGLGDC